LDRESTKRREAREAWIANGTNERERLEEPIADQTVPDPATTAKAG
jgi:hypothetical protein